MEIHPINQHAVEIVYTNHRGEVSKRKIVPLAVGYGNNDYHPNPQWLLEAHDVEKNELRTFAMKDVHAWKYP